MKPIFIATLVSIVGIFATLYLTDGHKEAKPCRKNLYAIVNDSTVVCHKGYVFECGLHLQDCDDGAEYWCVRSVKRTLVCP